MKPYYDESGITLYHGNALEVLPQLPDAVADVIITDPVWPNCVASLAGADDPAGLFAAAAAYFPRLTNRLVVHLGCDSDPRFLLGVPAALPFFRVCWLELVRHSYKGRLLYSGDVAYAFGAPPPSKPGRQVIPGRLINADDAAQTKGHPCPRKLSTVAWLVKWLANGLILDPFCGIGTTLRAAKYGGYPAIGIEIEERFCEAAVKRLAQGVFDFQET